MKLQKSVVEHLEEQWELEADIALCNYHSTITIIEKNGNIEIKFENDNTTQLINDCMEFAKLQKDIKKINMKYKNHKVLGKQLIPESNKLNLVNIRYTVDNLHFDAAIDINWELHAYNESSFEEENWKTTTAIEIYCLDNTDWDIKMIYQEAINSMSHTLVDFENLVEKTKEWIEVMKNIEIIRI